MNAKGHLLSGFAFSIFVIFLLDYLAFVKFSSSIENIVLLVLIISFYSLLPDIDHRSSKMTGYFLVIGFAALSISVFQLATTLQLVNDPIKLLIFSTVILFFPILGPRVFHHRGIIHSLLIGALATFFIHLLFNNTLFTIIAFASYYSHLLADGYLLKLK
ncbi:MAG: metal-dependent hydrolase [Nanoarchaeota archaeon]|nr:metal-dependent hydrolase [Nanoarchaeota archaeon]